jgi:dTDP-4-dehydrorhamnose 3,5-epimerase
MNFAETSLRGAYIIDPERHHDDRGYFARVFCRREFAAHGLPVEVAQTSVAFNGRKGTIRGLHFQYPPVAEAKLVRCTRGAMLDVIVDLRPESPTYLRHVSIEMSGRNGRSLFIPERFAHGYQTLEDDTEASYQMNEFYTPGADGGLLYSDPRLEIEWPLPVSVISSRDLAWPLLASCEDQLRERMTDSFRVRTR